MFVYLITNIVNGKRYVGQTIHTLEWRWKQHLKKGKFTALRNAINKYGADKFIIESICEPPTIELMNEFEQEYIQRYCTMSPNGYNLTTGGERPSPSQETRAKQSHAQLGKKQSQETKLKRAVALLGQKRSEETKRKMAEAQKGNQNRLGDTKSEEERKKISQSLQGNENAVGAVRTPEYCRQKSESQIGRIFSEATKQKMSEAASRRKASPETRAKLSASRKRLGVRPPVLSREALSEAGRISGHKRYHVNRNIINPNCSLCKEPQC